MFERMAFAMALGASLAGMLTQPAAARDAGLFGDARARCAFFAQAVPLNFNARPAQLPRYAGVAWRDKREHGEVHIRYHYMARHNRDTRCLAGF